MNEKRFYNGWDELFCEEFQKPYFVQLKEFLQQEYRTKQIYPPKKLLLNAFDHVSPNDTNVVILGQDPYINAGQAMGLSFSVPDGVRPPQSLANIFREIKEDLGYSSQIKGGNLTLWAQQGVLLLNTVLSVQHGQSNSHASKGWEQFTDKVICHLNQNRDGIVFLLWGNNAISKKRLISNPNHLVLTASHPSPMSARNGFFGCRHFSKTNEFLALQGKFIKW